MEVIDIVYRLQVGFFCVVSAEYKVAALCKMHCRQCKVDVICVFHGLFYMSLFDLVLNKILKHILKHNAPKNSDQNRCCAV